MIMDSKLPRISIVIPTYNEEENIDRCLRAVFEQDYPTELLQVFVVDGGSTDRTIEITQRYPITYVFNPQKLAEPAKMLGFSLATGDLFLYLDADLFLATKDWISKLVRPLVEDPTIIGSFTRYLPEKTDPPLNRYLSYHEFHLDPLLEFLCSPLENTFHENRPGYRVCWFKVGKIPPVGICIYRREPLKALIDQIDHFEWVDIAVPVILARAGHAKFAYIEDAGMYHLTIKNLHDLLQQKRRDATVTFLPSIDKREFTYIDLDRPFDIVKLAVWVLYANLIVPSTLRAIWKVYKYRDFACLYEIVVTPLITDYVVMLFLTDPYGRRLVRRFAKRLLGRR